jgi:hypothetical protein
VYSNFRKSHGSSRLSVSDPLRAAMGGMELRLVS